MNDSIQDLGKSEQSLKKKEARIREKKESKRSFDRQIDAIDLGMKDLNSILDQPWKDEEQQIDLDLVSEKTPNLNSVRVKGFIRELKGGKDKFKLECTKLKKELEDERKKPQNHSSKIQAEIAALENAVNDIKEQKIPTLEEQAEEAKALLKLIERVRLNDLETVSDDLYSAFNLIGINIQNFLVTDPEIPDISSDFYTYYCSEVYEGKFGLITKLISLTKFASYLFQEYLYSSSYIGPLRQRPKRFYILDKPFDSTEEQRGNNNGIDIETLRTPETLARLNKQLTKFEIGYKIELAYVSGISEAILETPDVCSLHFIDSKTNIPVNFADIGFGIGQILPLIIQSISQKNKTILIEQPELHIHPRLQTQMGYLFRDCINSHNKNNFIIETHSEHLMLRLQKLIRTKQLKSEDVCVIYVDRYETGSRCTELRLDKDGEFFDSWPDGFFEEGFQEILG